MPRIECKKHGVLTAMVPWAQSGSRFTRDFISLTAWLVKGGLSKKCVSGFRNIDSMISLIMLCCSSIRIPLPGREAQQSMKQGVK